MRSGQRVARLLRWIADLGVGRLDGTCARGSGGENHVVLCEGLADRFGEPVGYRWSGVIPHRRYSGRLPREGAKAAPVMNAPQKRRPVLRPREVPHEACPSRPAWGRRSRRRTATATPAPATVTAAVARSGSSTSPSTSPHTAAVTPNTAAVQPTRFFLSVTSAAFTIGSDHQPRHVSSSRYQSTMSESVPTVSASSWNGSAQAGSRLASVEHAVTRKVL